MRDQYRRAMQALYLACIVISGVAMVAITIMIPVGVFFRYVLNAALSWPEPASTVMMVAFSFLGGAAVYRAKVHVAVEALLNAVPPGVKTFMLWGVDLCMATIALFMLGYGWHLCVVTWPNTIAEFPGLSVGVTYLPIPAAGVLTLLFLVEKVWLGDPPKSDVMYSDMPQDLE
ncbi:MAG TPA: TRAP transporter small permease [Burkholderiales bacterium]|nr:TRAP transporter small permease [Burkholderiales bacterium]